jgi:hypothetical protein
VVEPESYNIFSPAKLVLWWVWILFIIVIIIILLKNFLKRKNW